MATEIADNPERSRYELLIDGQLAGLIDYQLGEGTISMLHAEVVPEFGGAGVGTQLVQAALKDVRERDLKVAPYCPFVASYIRKHPDDYLDLVTAAFQQKLAAT